MSSRALEQLDAVQAFLPRRRYEELPGDHVPFDELNHESGTERRLRRLILADEGLIFVVGPSGAGKSSLIAATTNGLPADKHAPIRVRVAALDEEVVDPLKMTLHILREVRAHAEGRQLTKAQRRRIEEAAADKRIARGASSRLEAGLRLMPLPGLTNDLRLSLASSALDREYGSNLTDATEGIARLRAMFEHHGRVPVFIMEDTDAWLRGPGARDQEPDVAEAFFTKNIARIARELEITLIVAAHDTYVDTPGYQRARDVMAGEIAVPHLSNPQDAIRAILRRRIERTDVETYVDDVFADEAIVRLEAEYDRGRSIRRLLRVAHEALEAAGPTFPERITAGHIRTAAIGDHRP